MRREWRLRAPADIRRVRGHGRRRAHGLFVLMAVPRADGPDLPTRTGVITGRRVGNAVARNRARRRLREITRRLHPLLAQGMDLLFIARPEITSAPFAEIEAAVRWALTDLRLLNRPEVPPCADSPSV